MNIKTYDIIKYLINQQYVIIQNSNTVYVKLINPLIIFHQCIDDNTTKITIKNNSGTYIENLIYYPCYCSTEQNCTIILLGNLENNQSISFEQKKEDSDYNTFKVHTK